MSANQLRVGIIGIGWYALRVHVSHLRRTGQAEVSAICRRNVDRLAAAQEALGVDAAFTDWREMLEQVALDAVIISTPNALHAEPSMAALAKGLHVLVEKPLATKSSDGWAMVRAAAQANRVLMVGYNCRGGAKWRRLKEQLTAGAIGQIRQINLVLAVDARWLWSDDPAPAWVKRTTAAVEPKSRDFLSDLVGAQNWRAHPSEMGGSTFTDIGSHAIDILLWMGGAPAVKVMAFMDAAGMPSAPFVSVQAQLANGVIVSCTFADGVAGTEDAPYGRGQLTIVGDAGLAIAEWNALNPLGANITIERGGVVEQVEATTEGTNIAAAFVAAVLDGTPNIAPAHEAAWVVDFTEATYRSGASGQVIHVNHKGQNSFRERPEL